MAIEIEGLVAEVPVGRRTRMAMLVEIALSPWRQLGTPNVESSVLRVQIPMDLDEADAWMSTLAPGDGVRIELDAAIAAGDTHARGSRLREHANAVTLAAREQ